MALPSSGQISFQQFNTDRGLTATAQIDMASAGTAYGVSYATNGTNQLGMDEFYGKSIGTSPPPPPASPTYAISPNVSSIDEGGTVTWNITTTNVANGTTLYWTNSGTTVGADFSDETNGGFFTINSNAGQIVKTLANDQSTEGSQTVVIQVRTGGSNGPIVVTSATVNVNDTSTTPVTPPPPPTYYSFNLGYHPSNADSACVAGVSPIYSLCSFLSNGCILRTSEGGSVAADGYWSDGTTVYYIEGGGLIQSVNACSATPPPPPPPPPPPSTWNEIQLAAGGGGAEGSACRRAQNGITSLRYINAFTLPDATAIALNSDGSGIPNDGNYSDGNVVRTLTNGVLSPGSIVCDIQ